MIQYVISFLVSLLVFFVTTLQFSTATAYVSGLIVLMGLMIYFELNEMFKNLGTRLRRIENGIKKR